MYVDEEVSRFRKKKRRKGFPKSLLLTIMEADTKKSKGPKARCARCGNTYVLPHMRYIRIQWLEHDYVCAMCYNRKTDVKV